MVSCRTSHNMYAARYLHLKFSSDSLNVNEQNEANAPSTHLTNRALRQSKHPKTIQHVAPSPASPVDAPASDPDVKSREADTDTQPTGQGVPHPRTHHYGTRTRNQFRRPGQDIGLNWEETRKEKDAVDAARAQKRAQEELRKAKAWAKAQHEVEGIERIAALELRRQQEDNEESEYLGRTGTACGYRSASSKANMAPNSNYGAKDADNSAASGSKYQDNEEAEPQSPARGDEGAEDELEIGQGLLQVEVQPAKKVSGQFLITTILHQRHTGRNPRWRWRGNARGKNKYAGASLKPASICRRSSAIMRGIPRPAAPHCQSKPRCLLPQPQSLTLAALYAACPTTTTTSTTTAISTFRCRMRI